jgi:hypothetical protein
MTRKRGMQQAVDARRASLPALWARRTVAADAATIEADLRPILGESARTVLDTLYPGALAAAATRLGTTQSA